MALFSMVIVSAMVDPAQMTSPLKMPTNIVLLKISTYYAG
jgi:hypothetical protein